MALWQASDESIHLAEYVLCRSNAHDHTTLLLAGRSLPISRYTFHPCSSTASCSVMSPEPHGGIGAASPAPQP